MSMATNGMHCKICDDDTVVWNFLDQDRHSYCTSCGEIDCQIDECDQYDYDEEQASFSISFCERTK